jgi:hypothetical protein
MQASQIAGLVAFVVMLGAGFLSQHADSNVERMAWYALAIGALLWYIIKGHDLKGWVGDSYQEMKDEISRLERLMARWEHSDGRSIPSEERSKIQARHQRLIEKIHFHPDAPRR